MLREIQQHPNTVDVNVETNEYYESVDELKDVAQSLDCDVVVNCCGLGNQKNVAHDKQLIGGRGVLLHYDRTHCPRRRQYDGDATTEEQEHDAVILTECGSWASETEPCYLIPRGDTIVVGGSYLEDDTYPQLRDSERHRLLQNAYNMGIDTTKAQHIGEWTGFRPYRPAVRCEEELFDSSSSSSNGVRVIHSYGHGGSGWTVNVGAAKEVVNILLNQPWDDREHVDDSIDILWHGCCTGQAAREVAVR